MNVAGRTNSNTHLLSFLQFQLQGQTFLSAPVSAKQALEVRNLVSITPGH